MLENQPKIIMHNNPTREVKSIEDPKFQQLMEETPEGKHPFYHAIGTLGGNATKEKYKR